MFCTKCGKEVETDWIRCPYCGNSLKEGLEFDDQGIIHKHAASEEQQEYDNVNTYVNKEEDIKKSRPLNLIIRIASLVSIICFFIPFATVSCAGQESRINQMDLVQGHDLVGHGSFWVLLFLIIPIMILVMNLLKKVSLGTRIIIGCIGGAAEIFWLIYLQVKLREICGHLHAEVSFSPFYWLDLFACIAVTGVYVYILFKSDIWKKEL